MYFSLMFTKEQVNFISIGNPQQASDAVDLTRSYLIQNFLKP